MTMKHTPGPWSVHTHNNIVRGPKKNTIADVRYKNGTADARLIAAAPDLLEALADMVVVAQESGWAESMTGRQLILKNAKAAIAKATGEA